MSRRSRSEAGVALIAAILVAAVVAAIAVALTTRDHYAILGATRLDEQAAATALAREVEVQAAAVLAQDLETSRHDDAGEGWATTPYGATRGALSARATLVDAQRLFNLNALAFQPPGNGDAEDDDVPNDDVPPPVDDAALDEASRANGSADAGTNDPPPRADDPSDDGVPQGDAAGFAALSNVAPGMLDGSGAPSVQGPPGSNGGGEDGRSLSPQQVAIARFNLLVQALGLPAEIVPPILDWLDADSDTRFPNGAEDEYYTRLDPPYRAANGPFADVSELRLVRGMTPEIYAKLAPLITVLGSSVPVNVNTAPPEVLMSLGPGLDRPTADLLVSSRQIQPFATVDALLRHPLLVGRPLVAQGLSVRSTYFDLHTRIEGEELPQFRRTLLERLSPERVRVVRRDREYDDG